MRTAWFQHHEFVGASSMLLKPQFCIIIIIINILEVHFTLFCISSHVEGAIVLKTNCRILLKEL